MPPSILLIPGSFGLPEFYAPVISAVAQAGYEIKALHLPSVGVATGQGRPGIGVPPPTMYDDAALIAGEAGRLVGNEGKDVMLVAHSYGGIPATESIKGLSKRDRQRDGKGPGGIVRIGYVTCLMPVAGESAADVLAQVPPDRRDQLAADENGWLYHTNVSAAAQLSFSGFPQEEGEAWIRRFPRHSAASFAGKLTHPGYSDVSVSYLICEKDRVIPPDIQRDGIAMIERESGRKVDVTTVQAGHVPMVNKVREVVDWILHMARQEE
ncbi:alpha/beta-hydrolase [Canariomyces notabilis]|uniref:Alpha/beta-hydrolase n=1 Tax=Canariomyces notabilis TaxID=2074819 RepID=A0AAN6TEZ4_9PEZI|nr:alpha/beta-hydrolase [Canariomyces arenarius]